MSLFHGPATVLSGLVLYLDAANPKSYTGSGSTWRDISGNGRAATLYNSPTYSSTQSGSFSFDGVDDYADLTTTLQFDTSDFTIAGWFRSNSGNSNYKQIWMSGYNGGQPVVEVGVTTGLYFYVRPPSPSGLGCNTATTVDDNQWRHFAAVKTSSLISLYLNGDFNVSTSGSFTSDVDSAGELPRIGNGTSTTNNRYFKGNISQIQVYNRAITATEIQQLFTATRGRYGL